MFQALQVAIEANNLGVSLLNKNQPGPALDILRGAADLMYSLTQDLRRELIVWSGNSELQQLQQERLKLQPPSCVLKIPSVQDKMREILSSEEHKDIANPRRGHSKNWQVENDVFLHKEGLRLSVPTTPTTCVLESATVLFNMALAHHLGCAYSLDCVELHNALTLYEMAASVAFKVEEKSSQTIVMASLNNMGHIYHQVGKYSVARDYLDDLSHYIMSLDPPQLVTTTAAADTSSSPSAAVFTDEQQQLDSATEQEQRKRFLLNAMFLHEPNGAPAA